VLSREEPSGYYSDFGTLGHLAKALEETFIYDGIYSKFRNRVHGRPVRGLSQHRFIGFIQNHDQVGNRAVGDRVNEVFGAGRAKIAAALVLLGPFIPMIFEGEEWAASTPFQYFADHEPELARLVTEGRKKEFGSFGWDPAKIPDPEKRETFLGSKLKWDELSEPEHEQMLTWYRELIRLRRCTPSLNYGEPGNTAVTYSEEQRWLCMRRGSICVACNIATEEQGLPIGASFELILASSASAQADGNSIKLPPDSVAIVRGGAGSR
jgi:maltooligosyltrehalose trehalohydrolase